MLDCVVSLPAAAGRVRCDQGSGATLYGSDRQNASGQLIHNVGWAEPVPIVAEPLSRVVGFRQAPPSRDTGCEDTSGRTDGIWDGRESSVHAGVSEQACKSCAV